MRFRFRVAVEVERLSGKFVSKDDLAAEVQEALDGANPDSLSVGDSEYDVTDWTVEQDLSAG